MAKKKKSPRRKSESIASRLDRLEAAIAQLTSTPPEVIPAAGTITPVTVSHTIVDRKNIIQAAEKAAEKLIKMDEEAAKEAYSATSFPPLVRRQLNMAKQLTAFRKRLPQLNNILKHLRNDFRNNKEVTVLYQEVRFHLDLLRNAIPDLDQV